MRENADLPSLNVQIGLADIACHAIQRILDPHILRYMATYDAASNICQALSTVCFMFPHCAGKGKISLNRKLLAGFFAESTRAGGVSRTSTLDRR
jgi:hypothetical protein